MENINTYGYRKNDEMRYLKGLLFDLDGTLIPSERVFFSTWKSVMEHNFSCSFTEDEYIDLEVNQDRALLPFLVSNERLSSLVDFNQVMQLVYEKYEDNFKLMLCNHSLDKELLILEKLRHDGIKIGLVTTSKHQFVNLFLEKFIRFREICDIYICREDVRHLKPHPEAYLKALHCLELIPHDCSAVEDSVKGIVSAQAAGLESLMVSEHTLVKIPLPQVAYYSKLEDLLLEIRYDKS